MPFALPRGSALAVAQSTAVARSLEAFGADVELIEIKTSGDETAPKPETGEFKDEALVKPLAQQCARLDDKGDLAAAIAPSWWLP